MTYLLIPFMFIAGWTFDRARGSDQFIAAKPLHDIGFALIGTACLYAAGAAAVSSLSYTLTPLLLSLSMLAGRAPGWGKYLGGIVHKVMPKEKEIRIIDWILDQIKRPDREEAILAMSLRGLWWTSCVAIPLSLWIGGSAILYALSGLLIGFIHWGAATLQKNPDKAWELGEQMRGAMIWGLFGVMCYAG